MFSLFKKNKRFTFVSPVSGQIIPITDVSDDVFSKEILGVGYAVKPDEDEFFAPISGTIESIFPTKHAISLKTSDNVEVLLHLGIDTVELNGAPFIITAVVGQNINAGDSLGTIDREQIKAAGKDDTIITVFTNKEKIAKFPTTSARTIEHGTSFGEITLK